MAAIETFYKKYGFLNYVERWEASDEPHGKFGTAPASVDGLRINDHFSKTTWTIHCQNDGKKDVKVFFTERKSTEFRNFMNMTVSQAVTEGFISKFSLACLYNRVDMDYGHSLSNDGDRKMGDLLTFNGDDFSVLYEMDYNWEGRLTRLKSLGLVTSDNTITRPFSLGRAPHVTEIGYSQQGDRKSFCLNFVGDASSRAQLSSSWNSKAYLIPDTSTSLTLTKAGTHDTIVCTSDFTIAGIDGGDDIVVEPGRPIKLSTASRTVNAGRKGIIFHVWK